MKVLLLTVLLTLSSAAKDCRVLVDGAGCRTRQLAIQRIWQKLPGIEAVRVLPREAAPADNQRIFLIRSRSEIPGLEDLVKALGRRAKHYRVVSVQPLKPE